MKFLIGITPQGIISYISRWGGHVIDKYSSEHSSFLTNLLPGDMVLADQGFTIADSVGFHCTRIVIPAIRVDNYDPWRCATIKCCGPVHIIRSTLSCWIALHWWEESSATLGWMRCASPWTNVSHLHQTSEGFQLSMWILMMCPAFTKIYLSLNNNQGFYM